MTQQQIYSISKYSSDKNAINAVITFNEKHDIFKGHFPGNPIVPGVIQVQIIKDLLEKYFSNDLLLVRSKNIKFLNFISPIKNKSVNVSITHQIFDDKSIKVKASIYSQDVIFLKFSGSFRD